MSDRQVSIRIGVTGKEDVKRAFDEVGKAGTDAFARVGTAMDAAGSAADRETQRLQRLAVAARQAAAADAAQSSFNQSLGIGAPAKSARESARIFEDTAKASADLEARTKTLRAQIDPLGAAQDRLNDEIANAGGLLKAGTITEVEHAAAVALAERNYQAAAEAIRKYGGDATLTTHQVLVLGSAARRAIETIIAGQNPLRMLSIEGIRVSAALGEGGLSGLLKGVAQGLLGLLTPTTIVVGGLSAIALGAGYATNRYLISEKELETSLGGMGRAAGATIDQLNKIADTASKTGHVSVAAAREMEEAFLHTGRIGVSSFDDLIEIAKSYAATTQQDIGKAVDELAKAFADPASGADALNSRLGFLDDRTRQYIRTLATQNDLTGAQRVLLDALKPALLDAADTTVALGRAWDFVKRNASDAVDAIGAAISRATYPSLQQQLEDLEREHSEAATIGGRYVPGALGLPGFQPARPLTAIDADIANVKRQIAEVERKAADAKADALAARTSTVAGDLARSLTPGFNELETLKKQQARLAAALNDPLARQKVADLKQVEAAYDAVSRAILTWLDPAEKARLLDELEIKALNARTPAEKAAIAEERRRIELSGAAVTAATTEADIARAGAKASADATRVIAEQSLALDTNTRATLEVAEAWLKGAAAAKEAEARQKALTEAIRTGVDVELRARQLLQEAIADQAAAAAKSADDLDAQASAQHRLNDAVLAGRLSSEEARRQMAVEQALRPLIVAEAVAEGDARQTLTRVVDALRGAYARLNTEEARAAALQTIEGQREQIALLQKQIELAGQSESQRAIVIAELQAEQDLRQRGIALASAEGQVIIANAGAIERLNQQLALSQSSTQELEGLTDTMFGHVSDLIAGGKLDWGSWADAGKAAILDIEQEMIKLALLNPLKNLLFGTNLPTVSSVGGVLGSILKGIGVGHSGGMAERLSNTRDVPLALFRFAPRLHDGAYLSPDEIPAILQRGERVLSREETRRYDARSRDAQPAVHVTIQTPSPAAFQASRTQIAADLARAVRAGMRGL